MVVDGVFVTAVCFSWSQPSV